MTIKFVTIFKYIAIVPLLFIGISCESDFENVGGDLVDNGVFNSKKQSFEVLAYSKNLESSRVDNIDTQEIQSLKMPLGVFDNQDFGLFKSSLIAQVAAPATLNWDDTSKLDAVYLEIPYDSKSIRETSDTKPKYELNNIIGDENEEFQIQIARLETYLSKLDPSDPSKYNHYFSDKNYSTSNILYPWENFKPNKNDTILIFERTLLKKAFDFSEIQENDTIKYTDSKPFIRFKLDTDFFKTNFMEHDDQSVFENRDDFINYFKGIVIDVQGSNGSVMMLDFNSAKINLYYTNKENKTADESDVDLNGDGDTNDTGITYPVRTKQTASFPLYGIKTNHFERDYSSANGFTQITNPDMEFGEKRLYVQGAAGSIAVIDLFKNVDLDEYRAKNWLINEASLTFYVDNQNKNEVPNRLLLYKLDPDESNDINEDSFLLDVITENSYFNGFLQTDDSESKNPVKYKVNITDYISEVLKKENYKKSAKLGLKLFNGIDALITTQDTIVKKYSWNPQNVVLFGNKLTESDVDFDKRLKLEIYYTEKK